VFIIVGLFISIGYNGQGLLQVWNSLLVCPKPMLIKDIKVQVNKQKLVSAYLLPGKTVKKSKIYLVFYTVQVSGRD
jgi:hypothetical protein